MGQCQYEHNGVKTCNIDTEFFVNMGQENLVPFFCYFHQIRFLWEYFDTLISPIKGEAELYTQAEIQTLLFNLHKKSEKLNNTSLSQLDKNQFFSKIWDFCDSARFDSNFNILMSNERIDFRFEGFVFPHQDGRLIFQGVSTPAWKQPFELTSSNIIPNYKIGFYNRLELSSLFHQFGKNKTFSLEQIKHFFIEPLLLYHQHDIKLHFHYVKFENSLNIKAATSNILVTNCTILGDIDISASKFELRDTIIESSKVQLSIPFENLTLSNNIWMDPVFNKAKWILIRDGEYMPFGQEDRNKQNNLVSQEKGKFENVDLKNVRFSAAGMMSGSTFDKDLDNINKLNFINCKFRDGHKLLEDGVHRKRLEYSYLYLRKLYDGRGEYIAGNDFYYNYNEFKRKHDNNLSKIDKLMLGLYGYMNGYNTKPEYTLQWILGIIILTALWHTGFQTFEIKDASYYAQIQKINTSGYTWLLLFLLLSLAGFINKIKDIKQYIIVFWMFGSMILTALFTLSIFKLYELMLILSYFGYSIIYSIISLVPTLKPPENTFGIINISGSIIASLESLFGIILIALLVLAFRNRFRRSKTPEEIKES